jgi:hypothetical protein
LGFRGQLSWNHNRISKPGLCTLDFQQEGQKHIAVSAKYWCDSMMEIMENKFSYSTMKGIILNLYKKYFAGEFSF